MSIIKDIQEITDKFREKCLGLPDAVSNGECEALSSFVLLKLFVKQIEAIIESIEEQAKDDRRRYAVKDRVELFGREIVLIGKTTWDYKPVTAWNLKKEEIKRIEKVAQIANTSNQAIVFEETGELIEPALFSKSEYIKLETMRTKK